MKKSVFLFSILPFTLGIVGCKQIATGYITLTCSSGGVLTSDAEEKKIYSVDTVIDLYPKADDGYKLTSLTVNGVDVISSEQFNLGKGLNEVKATFSSIESLKENLDYTFENDKIHIKDVENSTALPVMPSTGDVKCLVLPVNFSSYDAFTNEQLRNLEAAFNGSNSDDTNDYWESVKSFYHKSSYGNLNLSFTICDAFNTTLSSTNFNSLESNDGQGVKYILNEVYNQLTVDGNKIDYKNYDADSDGYVDGIWLVYNAKQSNEVLSQKKYRAYTYWNVDEKYTPNVNKPIFGVFANCSQLFLYTSDTNGQDSHTFIHETGHMFGLDDYYTYDGSVSATGGMDMMDFNIGDHSSFSKLILGWIKPRVYNIKDTTIELESFVETGDCILLSETKVDSPFDEYFLVEFYTNTSLNYLDSQYNYGKTSTTKGYNKLFDYSGVKITHIDARLAKMVDSKNSFINNGTITTLPEFPQYYPVYTLAMSNTPSYSLMQNKSKNYCLIEILTPSNVRSYGNSYFGKNEQNVEVLRGLFLENEVFSTSEQSNFFVNNKLHNGSTFDLSVTVTSIDDDKATIKIG